MKNRNGASHTPAPKAEETPLAKTIEREAEAAFTASLQDSDSTSTLIPGTSKSKLRSWFTPALAAASVLLTVTSVFAMRRAKKRRSVQSRSGARAFRGLMMAAEKVASLKRK